MDSLNLRQRILLNQPHIIAKTGSISSDYVTHFNTDMKAPLKECKVYFSPVQEGSGDPSPDNVRPITGWEEVRIVHSGVNLLDCDSPDYYINKSETADGIASTLTRNTDGKIESIIFNGTSTSTNIFRNLNYTPTKPNDVTMPSGKIALTTYSSQVYIVPMGGNKIPRTINNKAWDQSYTDTVDNWTVWDVDSYDTYEGLWIRAQIFPQQSGLNIDTTIYPMMCLAEDKGCEFEAYKGSNYNISWANDVGTVYGGYIDLVKGELVAEYESISDTWGNWGTLYDQGDGTELRYKKFTNNIIGGSAGLNSSYCNIAKYDYNNNNGTIHFYNVPTSNNCRIYLPSGTDINLQIQAVAKLAEPIHYQLTPQQLLTFKGTNNIWSNSNGQIEVKFWTH